MPCSEDMKGRLIAAVGAAAIFITAAAPAVAGERGVAIASATYAAARTQPLAAAVTPHHAAATKPPARQLRLTISTPTIRPAAGRSIRFTVRVLTAKRKPVAKVRVVVRLATSPQKDARLVTKSGKTNARGIFRDTLRLSRKPGRYVLVARAGRFTARLRLVSRQFRTVSHLATNPILAWVALATIGLLLLGIFVNLEVLRRVTWSLTLGRLRRRGARSP